MKKLVIGTRGSRLALFQANAVWDAICSVFPSLEVEIKVIETKGDKVLDTALSKIGEKGLFTQELENAMINGEIDIAVHSLKDLPTELPEGFVLSGVLRRGEVRDALVSNFRKSITEFNSNEKIATSSLRRASQIRSINPDVQIVDIRGNVDTRIKKLEEGYCDALILAGAGLVRLGKEESISEYLNPNEFVPAVCQGVIGIESRIDNSEVNKVIEDITDKKTMLVANAERVFLKTIEGGCQIPVGCYTEIDKEEFIITGFVGDIEGKTMIRQSLATEIENAVEASRALANRMLESGARDILNGIRK